jgi:hypothetical protein
MGAGMYVLGVVAEPIEINSFKTESLNIMNCFKICFELNPGDEINVVASKMVLEEKDNDQGLGEDEGSVCQ